MASVASTARRPSGDSSGEFRPAVTLVLAIGALLPAVNGMSLGAFLPVISRDLSVSIPLLGQITTAIFFGAAGVGLLAGPLADQYGKRRLLLIGLSVLIISCLGTMVAPTFGWLLAARMISAVSAGTIIGTSMAVAGSLYAGENRQRAMSWIAGGVASGAIVGVPILTMVASVTSWRGAYGFLAVVTLLWVLFVRRSLPDDQPQDTGAIDLRGILDSYKPLLEQRTMLKLYSATLIRSVGWVGTLTYVGAYLGDAFAVSTRELGWVYMIAASGYFLGTKLAERSYRGLSVKGLYAISTSICGLLLGLAIALPFGVEVTVAVLAVGAVGGGIGWVLLVTLVSAESAAGQGTTMSLNQAMFALGSASGALLGGILIAAGGYTGLALGLMGFMTIAAVIVWRPASSSEPVPSPPVSGCRDARLVVGDAKEQ